MTVYSLLLAARARIAEEAHWTQVEFARTADGEACGPVSSLAVCRCVAGALRCEGGENFDRRDDAYAAVMRQTGDNPTAWNDTHTHAEVLAMFDLAIHAEAQREKA